MKKTIAFLAALTLSACMGDESANVVNLSGKTMGTTYNVTAVGVPDNLEQTDISDAVEAVLADVNAKLSNWDKNSEVSRFNGSSETSPAGVSGDFITVMTAANEVHSLSGGKFDVTLGPLIELWGFGPRKPEDPVPSDAAVEEALEFVGQSEMLTVDKAASTISKREPKVGINLSAIAKGYGIDAVAAKLKDLGIENYMVEIGGDLVTAGQNDKGEAWKIGIEKPEPGEQAVELIVSLKDKGLATSGDYRNFVEYDGIRYSHIIDPVTGKPITHWTTSVSVLADNAMMADAWATAMLVLGSEKGLDIAEANNIAVYFISRDENGDKGAYVTRASSAFTALQDAK
jgi:thiamine biosynthesis lipoprotein